MIRYSVTRRGAAYGEEPIVVTSLRAAIRALHYGSPIALVPGERAAFRTPSGRGGMHHRSYVARYGAGHWVAYDCAIGRTTDASCTWIGSIRRLEGSHA